MSQRLLFPNETKMRALSVRQPHAEAIIRGVKTIEYRSRATNVRGRVYIYAAKGRYSAEQEAQFAQQYGMDDVESLDRGVLIGTVEISGCDGGEWQLASPQRLETPIAPEKQPQPVWFKPF